MKRSLLLIIALSVVLLFSINVYAEPKGEEPSGVNSGTHAPANGHDKDNKGKGHNGHGKGWGLGHEKHGCNDVVVCPSACEGGDNYCNQNCPVGCEDADCTGPPPE